MMDCHAKNPACFAPDVCFPETCHFLAKHEADRAPYIQAHDARFMGGWGAFGFTVKLLAQDFCMAMFSAAAICLVSACIVLIISLFLKW